MPSRYLFIIIVTIICSLFLSITDSVYKQQINDNKALDRKKNILLCTDINRDSLLSYEPLKIEEEYRNRIVEKVLEVNEDGIVSDESIKISDLMINDDLTTGMQTYLKDGKEYLPLYETENRIIIPISGKGLWSTLYGFFAIDKQDYNTVKAITFYQHKETPGLGGEVDSEKFQNEFVGKKIYDNDWNLESIGIVKAPNNNQVQAISGATITSNGLNDFLKRDLSRYNEYFLSERSLNE